jgi:hypothetical protein
MEPFTSEATEDDSDEGYGESEAGHDEPFVLHGGHVRSVVCDIVLSCSSISKSVPMCSFSTTPRILTSRARPATTLPSQAMKCSTGARLRFTRILEKVRACAACMSGGGLARYTICAQGCSTRPRHIQPTTCSASATTSKRYDPAHLGCSRTHAHMRAHTPLVSFGLAAFRCSRG